MGFGQGDGLRMVWDRIAAGNGKVFGLELSKAMLKEVEGNLVSKASIPGLTNRIILDRVCFMLYMIHTPYHSGRERHGIYISMEETNFKGKLKAKQKLLFALSYLHREWLE